MRSNRNDFCFRPVVVTQNVKAPNVSADVDYRVNIVRAHIADLILILEHPVCKLSTGGFDVKVTTEDLVSGWEAGHTWSPFLRIESGTNSMGMRSCLSQAPRQTPSECKSSTIKSLSGC